VGAVQAFLSGRPFNAATCDAMGLAFDRAWQNLLVSGAHLASSDYEDATREALAIHIIDLAKTGERDVNRLRDDAVAFVLDALQCKQAWPAERRPEMTGEGEGTARLT
jgi:hypothetical protein